MRTTIAVALAASTTWASAQSPKLVAGLLGKPFSAYGKAYKNTALVTRMGMRTGKYKVGTYKTPQATIEVSLQGKATCPNHVTVLFRKLPGLTWQQALADVGISSSGAHPLLVNYGKLILIQNLRAPGSLKVDGQFAAADPQNAGNPSLYLILK